ncbi:hypothetical protein A3862_24315 [Methylobacterium sp. XJLW]|nr:hypothetical protein [Methylobacterium sp. XJLW]AWV18250.1 hypothetical protein A3862_24315 [Methylobacterium sp. XJLW]
MVLLGPVRRGPLISELARHRADHDVLAADRLLQRLAEVAQQMPAVQDVHRLGRPQPDGLAIDLGPVAGDDLNPGMAPQPSGDRFGLAIGQEIGDDPTFQIDDHRAVAAPALPGRLIDSDHARR